MARKIRQIYAGQINLQKCYCCLKGVVAAAAETANLQDTTAAIKTVQDSLHYEQPKLEFGLPIRNSLLHTSL